MVQIEVLEGREVRDVDGKVAGRLEDVHADWRGGECIVTHYVLSAGSSPIAFFLQLLGAEKKRGKIVVPWDKLDLPTMRLTCRIADLVQ